MSNVSEEKGYPMKDPSSPRLSIRLAVVLGAALAVAVFLQRPQTVDAVPQASADLSGTFNPYADNNGDRLPPGYSGPRYRLNHHYPTSAPPSPANPPWRQALKGAPIGKGNAIAYVQALKDYLASDVKPLVNDYTKWDPFTVGWYDQPWIAPKLASWPGREPIQGAYPGPGFEKTVYPDLKVPFIQDYVAVYYNNIAGYTLHQLWQSPNPYQPNPAGAQFQEGAISIKLAMTTASGTDWAPMQGSTQSNVFVPPPTATSPTPPGVAPKIVPVYVMQLDIIVKDTKTAPKTGWVFSTLVYNKDAKGATTWDKMVPLGAMWGNDPGVNNNALQETVINPVAPAYAKITLGWGLRLSGPNDGATNSLNPPVEPTRISSCMSCHGTAESPGGLSLVPFNATTKMFYTPGSRRGINGSRIEAAPCRKYRRRTWRSITTWCRCRP